MNTNSPHLSVCVITYNHEKHISKTITGILEQGVNIHYELVIGEDSSTDKTKQICEFYAKAYPALIFYESSAKQLGMMYNFQSTLSRCTGKYIAICEGDDYWIDPDKLQMQLDFLEANPEYVLCHHRYLIESPSGLSLSPKVKETTTIEDLARNNHIGTLTCMFRNLISEDVPNWISKAHMGDYPLFMHLARYGKIKYFDKPMAVYRVHPGGVWNSLKAEEKIRKEIEAKELMISQGNFSNEVRRILRDSVNEKKMVLLRSRLAISKSDDLIIISKELEDEYTNEELAKQLVLSQMSIVNIERRNKLTISYKVERLITSALRRVVLQKQLVRLRLKIMLVCKRYKVYRARIRK